MTWILSMIILGLLIVVAPLLYGMHRSRIRLLEDKIQAIQDQVEFYKETNDQLRKVCETLGKEKGFPSPKESKPTPKVAPPPVETNFDSWGSFPFGHQTYHTKTTFVVNGKQVDNLTPEQKANVDSILAGVQETLRGASKQVEDISKGFVPPQKLWLQRRKEVGTKSGLR